MSLEHSWRYPTLSQSEKQPDMTPRADIPLEQPSKSRELPSAGSREVWGFGSSILHRGVGNGGHNVKGNLHFSSLGCLHLGWHVQPFREVKWITPLWVSAGCGEDSEKRNVAGSSATQVTLQTQKNVMHIEIQLLNQATKFLLQITWNITGQQQYITS